MAERHFLVSGRVQGVGFRAFVQRQAIVFNLSGLVRNLSDGRVEMIVSGPVDRIDLFAHEVKRGPPQAMVSLLESRAGASETAIVDASADRSQKSAPVIPDGRFLICEDGASPWKF